MGLLDQILGGIAGGALGRTPAGRSMGGGSRILMALLPVVLGMLANRQRGGTGGVGSPGTGGGLGGLGGMVAGMGGLGALIEQFTRRGYGHQAHSWVGTGPNEALPPEALNEVFGADQLSQIASQAGLSEEEARMGLSELLPEVVDGLTPEGRMPSQDELMSSIDEYERRLTGQ